MGVVRAGWVVRKRPRQKMSWFGVGRLYGWVPIFGKPHTKVRKIKSVFCRKPVHAKIVSNQCRWVYEGGACEPKNTSERIASPRPLAEPPSLAPARVS